MITVQREEEHWVFSATWVSKANIDVPVTSNVDVSEKKRKLRNHERSRKRAHRTEELEISWWRTSADVFLLQFKKSKREENR